MTVDASTLVDYAGKQVVMHLIQEDGSLREVEGKIEDASEVGLAFKEKGKRDISLVLPNEVEEIEAAPIKPKKVVQKKLKPVQAANVRQHLADRHGLLISELNEMTDEDAETYHNSIDHGDLGHRHEVPSDKNDEAGESEGDSDEE